MLNLPPLAQTIVIAALIIGYIVTFFFQKNKIEILKGTVTSLKDLTDGQKNHIDTYKEMVSLDAIKENIEIQRQLQFKKTYDQLANHFMKSNTEPLLEKLQEYCVFLGHLFYDTDFNIEDRFSDIERTSIIEKYFPKNKNLLVAWFSKCRLIFGTQTPPTQ